MARYIDAELLADKIIEDRELFVAKEDLLNHGYVLKTIFKDLSDVVNDIPTADVVKVVRCKDCKAWSQWSDCDTYGYCWSHGTNMYYNDFCSYGGG